MQDKRPLVKVVFTLPLMRHLEFSWVSRNTTATCVCVCKTEEVRDSFLEVQDGEHKPEKRES